MIPRAVEVGRVVDDSSLSCGVASRHGVTVVDAGAFDFWYRGAVHTQGPGQLKLKEPGEVMRDRAVHAPVTAATVSLAAGFVDALAGGAAPSWREVVTVDARLERLARAVAAAVEPLEREAAATALVGLLLARHADPPRRDRGPTAPVARARALLLDRLAAPPTLDELAEAVGTGKFRLARSFRAAVGMPPYAYLVHLRIARAKELLAAGGGAAAVAAEVGFCDQSQMHRHFRRIVGMSPGAYARAMRG